LNAVDTTPPVITDATANPPTIEANGTDDTLLNVTATDFHGIALVSVNLSAIGGSPAQAMTNNSGVWQFTTNTTVNGKNGTLINLPLNVTDGGGNSNTSCNIALGLKLKKAISAGNVTPFNVTVNGTKLNVTVSVPVDTNLSSGMLTAAPVAPPSMPGGFEFGGVAVDLNGLTFNKSLTITLEYLAATQNQTKLRLWFYNATADRWEMIEGSTVNTTAHTVSGNVDHFTVFAPLADTTPPTISITSPAHGYSTTECSITVSGYVDGTGSTPTVIVNGYTTALELVGYAGTYSVSIPLSIGTNTITAIATDTSDNNESVSITVTRRSTGNGGGGGGGGGSSGEPYENIEFKDAARVYVSKDAQISFTFDEPENDIQYVNYRALTSAGYISTVIEVLKNTSTFAKEAPSGMIYKNLNIWVGTSGYATEINIEDPVVGFKVEKKWIEDNNIEESSIKLNRYHEDTWTVLPTERTDEDAAYVYFESQTPGFSPFAITGQKKTLIAPPTAPPEEPTEEPTPAITPTAEVEAPPEKPPIWKYLLTGAVVLLIIAGAYLYMRKRQG
jgi:PGF-pre-PGF domain-containing protein